jgi:hypothetical protein
LAFLNFSLVGDNERWLHLGSLIDLLDTRLTNMKNLLTVLLSGQMDPSDGGTQLPLAHGLIQSLQHVLGHMEISYDKLEDDNAPRRQEMCQKMAEIFCRAIQVSLAVVADVKDGSIIEGMDEDMITATDGGSETGTPLNVNTGAIGANGTFSSINPTEEVELRRRIAIQRIVVSRLQPPMNLKFHTVPLTFFTFLTDGIVATDKRNMCRSSFGVDFQNLLDATLFN